MTIRSVNFEIDAVTFGTPIIPTLPDFLPFSVPFGGGKNIVAPYIRILNPTRMYSINRAQVIGNAAADPEVRETPGGAKVANFSVATNRAWTDKDGERREEVEFHAVVLWGALAETAEKYVSKGNRVFVEGRLQTRQWEGKDGEKRSKTEIVAEQLILLTPKASAPETRKAPAKFAKAK